ncbi:beta strand repeat-containing protein, partial [Undibacterium baiyunense]
AASAVGAQKITTGSGNDTVIFDALDDNRAGLTISDTVDGGTGSDTLVIDGNLSVAGVIALGASEWTNVSNFETIRLVNAGAGSSYSLTLTDTLISKNNASGVLSIVNDNDTANDSAATADTAGVSNESAVVIDARALSNVSRFNYNGEEGASRTTDRIILSDVSLNGTHNINGGAVDNDATNNSQKNDDVLELRNATNASMGDFSGISNIGTIELTNDTAVSQVSQIQLNDNIVNAMVDSYQAANTTTHVERLTIRALGNTNFATATVGVTLDAATLTAASALDVTLGRGANNLQLGAGSDRVVLLGNYVAGTYTATENGVSINGQSTAGAVARVVNDTINLGGGNDTLVTYGAIDLSGATLSGIENITNNSAVVLTASQYNALIAARASLGLSGPVLTFSGTGPHQLTIVDDVGGINNIDLSYISVSGGTLLYDVTSASNATGGGTNNITTSNAVNVSGTGAAIAGTVGTTPSNNGGGSTNVNLTAGGIFNGTTSIAENFTGVSAAFVGTTINGNGSDTDKITFTGGGSIVIGGGNTITNIKTLATDNTSTDIYFVVSTAGINTINGGTGNDRVYLANSGNSMLAGNINLGAGNNQLSLEGKTYTGTFGAGAGTSDILNMVNSSDISGATVTGFESLVVSSNGSITLSAAQYSAFSSINALSTNNITFATAGNIVGNSTVENYTLANGSNNFTGTAGIVSVIGGTGSDTFNVGSFDIIMTIAPNGIDGGTGPGDTLNVGAVIAALDMSNKVTGVETINVTAGTNAFWTITNANGAGTILNLTKSATTALNNVLLGSGGQTLNVIGTGSGAITITGGSGADTINLSTSTLGSDTIMAGSTIAAIDTVSNFKAVGSDQFKTGVAATTLDTLTIAFADIATLPGAITTAATAAGAAFAANTQAYLITVNGGTAAGTYVFQNIGGTVGAVDATDFIVQLIGITGSIVVGDFVA